MSSLHATLTRLARDRSRGASAITRDLAVAVRDATALDSGTDSPIDPSELRRDLLTVRRGQAAMASVLGLVDALLAAMDFDQAQASRARLRAEAGRWVDHLAMVNDALAGRLMELVLPRTLPLVLYSSSSTVLNVLARHDVRQVLGGADDLPRAIVAGSAPGMEGVAVADTLAGLDWQVELLSDAALADRLACEPARLLLGADAITPTRVLNKVGSAGLVALVRRTGGEIIVLAGTEKELTREQARDLDVGSAGTFDDAMPSHAGITVHDPLFGWIDRCDITMWVHEHGTERADSAAPRQGEPSGGDNPSRGRQP